MFFMVVRKDVDVDLRSEAQRIAEFKMQRSFANSEPISTQSLGPGFGVDVPREKPGEFHRLVGQSVHGVYQELRKRNPEAGDWHYSTLAEVTGSLRVDFSGGGGTVKDSRRYLCFSLW